MSIYDTLNPPQREAVAQTEGPVLILAGAGSGKTRVLTHRIAYLMEEMGVNPWNILAITFTNKAAQEMRERVDKLVGFGSESIWVSTFHSACVRILRRHIDNLGYDTNFTIYDTDDQKSLMKDVCRKLNIDTKVYKERSLLAQISHAKDELLTPDDMEMKAAGDYNMKKVASVYREYQAESRGALQCRSPCGERGLKSSFARRARNPLGRSPCGERGLKSSTVCGRSIQPCRSPCGERGLKSPSSVLVASRYHVAPRAGSVD